MNQVTKEQKETTTKLLAIVGFLVVIIFMVFAAVKLVSFLPSAFSSLASLADSVYNYKNVPELTVTTKESVVNAGESFTINWNEQKLKGGFVFSYTCVDGAALDTRNSDGAIVPLDCDKELKLGNRTSLDLMVNTEKQRFTDVVYTIAFVPSDPREATLSTENRVTVVNVSIPTNGVATPETPVVKPVEPEVTEPTTPVVTPKPTTPVLNSPKYITSVTYSVPKSDPNGKTDLQVTYLGVGTIRNGIFTPTAKIDTRTQGAIRFAVKNIGTKTSDDWYYIANLPASATYTSKDQVVLKPNEEAIITIGFNGVDRSGTETFGVNVKTKDDSNLNNNSFTWAVTVK